MPDIYAAAAAPEKRVTIRIAARHDREEGDEEIVTEHTGTCRWDGERLTVTYMEESGTESILTAGDGWLLVEREGMLLRFAEGLRHSARQALPFGTLHWETQTERLQLRYGQDHLLARVVYTLYADGEAVSHVRLRISVRP